MVSFNIFSILIKKSIPTVLCFASFAGLPASLLQIAVFPFTTKTLIIIFGHFFAHRCRISVDTILSLVGFLEGLKLFAIAIIAGLRARQERSSVANVFATLQSTVNTLASVGDSQAAK